MQSKLNVDSAIFRRFCSTTCKLLSNEDVKGHRKLTVPVTLGYCATHRSKSGIKARMEEAEIKLGLAGPKGPPHNI